jgi:hypothetical protein
MPELYSAQPKTEKKAGTSTGTKVKSLREFLPKPKGGSLSSLLVLPGSKVRFETQEPEEEILLILRSHWITNLSWILLAVILSFIPVSLLYIPLLQSFPARFQLMFVIIWYLVLLMFIFEKFLTWFFNITIITDERIIDVDFFNLTTKKVSDAELDKIQDVSFTRKGVFQTIFNFGDILVQTAAEHAQFVFEKIPEPSEVANILQRLRTEEKIEALEGRIR